MLGKPLHQLQRIFLENHKAPNYEKCVTKMLEAYKEMSARMSLKMHFLHSHLDFFPENNSDVSDEHGERFHQDISTTFSKPLKNSLRLRKCACFIVSQ